MQEQKQAQTLTLPSAVSVCFWELCSVASCKRASCGRSGKGKGGKGKGKGDKNKDDPEEEHALNPKIVNVCRTPIVFSVHGALTVTLSKT